MDPRVAQEAFQVVSNVTTTVARELIVGRKEERMMEKRAEKDKRIAELEAGVRECGSSSRASTQSQGPERQSQPQQDTRRTQQSQRQSGQEQEPQPPEPQPGMRVDVSPLVENEHCEMCVRLLEGVENLPAEKRAVGLTEYGKMKQAVDNGAEPAELRQFIEESDVLSDVVETLM